MKSLDVDYLLATSDPEYYKITDPEAFKKQIMWRVSKPSTLDLKTFNSWLEEGKELYRNKPKRYREIRRQELRNFLDRIFLYERRN